MVEIVFYMDGRGSAPVLAWLKSLDRKAQIKCTAKIERLKELGHKMDRPEAAYLRDKIYELRVASDRNQYRILYFFSGREVVVLSHSFLKKTDEVPKRDIQKAITRKEVFERNPEKHKYKYKGLTDG